MISFQGSTIAAVIVRAVALISTVLIVPAAISRCSLSKELDAVEAQLASKVEQLVALESKLALQNQAAETLNAQTQAAEARFERAALAVESQNKKLDRTIAQLKAVKGTNCDDAMPLVDEIIRHNR